MQLNDFINKFYQSSQYTPILRSSWKEILGSLCSHLFKHQNSFLEFAN